MIKWNEIQQVQLGRQLLVEYAQRWIGTPYHWGTSGHGGDDFMGMDCSGFSSEAFQSVGLCANNLRLTADGWLNYFRVRECAENYSPGGPGWIQFHINPNSNKVFHMMICVNSLIVVGASGGDDSVGDDQAAALKNAFVKQRPYDYVKDTAGRKIIYLDPFSQKYG